MKKIILCFFFTLIFCDEIVYTENGKVIEIKDVVITNDDKYSIYYKKRGVGNKVEYISKKKVIKIYISDLNEWKNLKDYQYSNILNNHNNNKSIKNNNSISRVVKNKKKYILGGFVLSRGGNNSNIWGIWLGDNFSLMNKNQPNFFDGWHFHWYFDSISSYEDYTDVMGSVNSFNDRNDGHESEETNIGLGLIKNIGTSFITVGGEFINSKYYKLLYDSLEILGNNGKYYIDGDISTNNTIGLFFDLNLNIVNNHYLTISYGTASKSNIRFGWTWGS